MFPSLLIVDDKPAILQTLKGLLEDEGFEVTTALNGFEALQKLEKEMPDLILLDIWMPGMDGIDTLKEIMKIDPDIPVIMITGHGTIDTAVTAAKSGAFDFIEKPLSIDKVLVTINNALNFRKLEEELRYLKKKNLDKNAITGSSELINKLKFNILQAASEDSPLLITGENGTGKELVAQNLHRMGKRSEEPFICVNCASLSPDNAKSRLFGQERGENNRPRIKGYLEMAHKGSLFLDQLADLPLNAQGYLLRFLDNAYFHKVGGNREIKVDIRIISASNMDLKEESEKGNFRKDLYYRLAALELEVPPLRERKEDIEELAKLFLAKAAEKSKLKIADIEEEALKLLKDYSWPGNVRELKNLMGRLAIARAGRKTGIDDLKELIDKTTLSDPMQEKNYKKALALFSEIYLKKQFDLYEKDIEKAAMACGLKAEEFKTLMERREDENYSGQS